jgi:hypothetical protein
MKTFTAPFAVLMLLAIALLGGAGCRPDRDRRGRGHGSGSSSNSSSNSGSSGGCTDASMCPGTDTGARPEPVPMANVVSTMRRPGHTDPDAERLQASVCDGMGMLATNNDDTDIR